MVIEATDERNGQKVAIKKKIVKFLVILQMQKEYCVN